MLDFLRKKQHSWIFKAVFAFIILSFAAFFGLDRFGNADQNRRATVAVTVNGESISTKYLDHTLERNPQIQENRERYQAMFKGKIPDFIEESLRQNAINLLVDYTLVDQDLKRIGLITSPAELKKTIVELPQFNSDGIFNYDYYHNQFLKSYNLATGKSFEANLSSELVRGDLIQGLVQTEYTFANWAAARQNLAAKEYTFDVIRVSKTQPKPDSSTQADKPAPDALPDPSKRAADVLARLKTARLTNDQLKAQKLSVDTTSALTIDQFDTMFDEQLPIETILELAKLTPQSPVPGSVLEDKTNFYAIRLVNIKPSATAPDTKAQIAEISANLQNSIINAYVEDLRERATIVHTK